MPIKEQEIFNIIDRIRDHYHNNIYNRYIRKAFILMKIPRETQDALDHFTEKTDYYKLQGYQYKELYEQIFAAATFVHHAKQEVMPKIKSILAGGSETVLSRQSGDTDRDRILREMAINNFSSNLGIFSDMINELYIKTANLDKEEHVGRKPVYERMPELKEIGQLLI